MNTFFNNNPPSKPADWGIISTVPLIEINISLQSQRHYVLDAATAADTPSKYDRVNSRKGVDAVNCDLEKIPGELFRKNEKFLAFMDNINCCR